MHETGFTKLFSTIVTSTIWQEDKETKILWITMLATANRYGEVAGSEPGLANLSRLSLDETIKAIKKLESPDKYSRSQDNEGRRIERIDGGWQILNYGVYREKMRTRDPEYFRNLRAAKKAAQPFATARNHLQPRATNVTPAQPIAEAKAEAKAYKNTIAQNFDKFWQVYPKSRRIGKKQTEQQWIKINPDEQLIEKICLSVVTYKQTEQWIKEGGKYIPYPERFLKHRRWEDEVEIIQHKTPFQLSMEAIENEEKSK